MQTKLRPKQKTFIKEYIKNGGNGTQAALEAYDTKSERVAAVIASENLTKPDIKDYLEEIGFTSDNAKEVVAEILSDETNEPKDRLKAAEMIFKVHGDYAPEKSINVNVEVEASSEVKELTEKLNGIYRGTSVGSDGGTPRALGTEAQN